ncbi:hypothetical protein ACOSQ3_003628 [Xanthoceras sorbifolium]
MPSPPPFPVPATPPSHSPPSPIVRPHHSTVITVVFVSLGGLFFLAFLSVALCCFIKKKMKRTVQKAEIIKVDEHVKAQEAVIPGPHGEQIIVLIEEDVHILEDIMKIDIVNGISHTKSSEHHPQSIDVAAFCTSSSHHHIEHQG